MPPGDKYFLSLRNATHLHFSEGIDTAARSETQGIVEALAVAFLRTHLEDDDTAGATFLTETYADGLAAGAIPDVDWSEK